MITIVDKCCNGWCKYMVDLKCEADFIELDNGGYCKTYEDKEDEDE